MNTIEYSCMSFVIEQQQITFHETNLILSQMWIKKVYVPRDIRHCSQILAGTYKSSVGCVQDNLSDHCQFGQVEDRELVTRGCSNTVGVEQYQQAFISTRGGEDSRLHDVVVGQDMVEYIDPLSSAYQTLQPKWLGQKSEIYLSLID